jgi:NADH:ubiquinone oxidoreductase subunit 3 (subunit A)
MTAYIPILFYALLVLSFPFVALRIVGVATVVSAESETNVLRSTRVYLLTMLFVVFCVQMIFLFLWIRLYRTWAAKHLFGFATASMSVFVGILGIGYVWTYKKGALRWE